ncbi:ComEA family DNA-binding protein [Desulfolithobacter sp.]
MTGARLCKKDKRLLVLLAFGWWLITEPLLYRSQPLSPEPPLRKEGEQGVQVLLDESGESDDPEKVADDGKPPPRLALLLGRPVPVNQADARTLVMLPGIGPRLADNIIRFRSEHGSIQGDENLLQVEGIGTETLKRLRPLITYDQEP